jgi:hypothetical protein
MMAQFLGRFVNAYSTRISGAAACAVLVLGGCFAPNTAHAQGTVIASDQRALADAYWRSGTTFNRNMGDSHDTTSGNNFSAIEDRDHSFDGFSGRGYAQHGATFFAANPGIGGQFNALTMDACTSAEIYTADTSNSEDRAYGLARGEVMFSIDVAHDWDWIGAWQGATYDSGAYYRVVGEISLVNVNTGIPIVMDTRTSLNGAGDWADPISLAGQIDAGTYRITWMHESVVANGFTPWGFFGATIGGAPLISCVNSTFTMTPVPGPSTLSIACGALLVVSRRRR